MAAGKRRTSEYSEAARKRLGDAVAAARRAAGHRWRTTFLAESNISRRSLDAVERGEPGVGPSVLEEIGRVLGRYHPNWNEGTPWVILDGGAIPDLDEAPKAAPLIDPDPDQPLSSYLQSLSGLQVFSDAWLAAVAEELVKNEVDPEETDRFMTMIAQMAGRARAQMREIQRAITERRMADRAQ